MDKNAPGAKAELPAVQVIKEYYEDESPSTPDVLTEFTCDRCGYKYRKGFDFPPFLCYRCMRFLAKRLFTVMHTIQPPISRPKTGDI